MRADTGEKAYARPRSSEPRLLAMNVFGSLYDAFWLIADHRELTVPHVPFVSRKCESCDRERRNNGTISKIILEPSRERLYGMQRLKAYGCNRCKGIDARHLYRGNM